MKPDRLVIIDGYNLILRNPRLRPEAGRSMQDAREKLVNLLSWVVGSGDVQFLVVFDGAREVSGDQRDGRVEVRFSKPPETADDVIRRLVEERMRSVERLTVVTSDVEVARHARAMGADIALSDLFLGSVIGPAPADPAEKPSTLSKKELEEWAELFRSRPRDTSAEDEDTLH